MIKLSSTWHIPDSELPDVIDRYYFDVHVPNVRRLPNLRRHVVMKAVPVGAGMMRGFLESGEYPRIWRGEDIWFDNREEFEAATDSSEWKSIAVDGLFSMVAGAQSDLFEVAEEYRISEESIECKVAQIEYIVDRGTWHVPDQEEPDDIDRHYFDIHVGNVRRLPSIRRHVVMKSASWPAGRNPRCWRGADCWKDSSKVDEDQKFEIDDGYIPLLAGLEFDRFRVQEEWISDSASG